MTWLATYPNAELGITDEMLAAYLDREKSRAERIAFSKDRIKNSQDSKAFVAISDNQVVGYGVGMYLDGKPTVGAMYVRPEHQGKGLGSQLMQKVLEWLGNEDIELTVVQYNKKAIKFYQKWGFEIVGEEPEAELRVIAPGIKLPNYVMVRKPSK